MIFWMLMGHFATIFLSPQFSTTIEFNQPIEQVIYGGSKNDLYIYLANNKKTLIIKPLEKSLNSNLTIIAKDQNYHFWIQMDHDRPHVFVQLQKGQVNSIYQTVFENDDLKIQEGSSSVLIINKKKTPLEVNGKKVESQDYFSKGIPLIVNGVRIYN